MIHGVQRHPLRQILDERGKVMHMLRCDDPWFEKFGEIYFSWVYPGVIKGWHIHRRMALNYAVPSGAVKLVLYDDRSDSPTRGEVQVLFTGEHDFQLIHIPPGIWNGFKSVGTRPAMVANCATEPHDPTEIARLDPLSDVIPYDWSLKHA
jgi:dTDP-4-dehydrorhamnose 3,5-epimerase